MIYVIIVFSHIVNNKCDNPQVENLLLGWYLISCIVKLGLGEFVTMYNNNKILAVIPARGGSKGVPRKNIREVGGKPLIVWTIEEAKKSKYIDRLILSSEDKEIIEVAEQWGCEVPFVRPTRIAQDNTPGIEPVLHAIEEMPGYDYFILLQPTSPLRKVEDIDGCISFCINKNALSAVSVTKIDKNPKWIFNVSREKKLMSFYKNTDIPEGRQSNNPVYVLNGAVFIAAIKWLIQHKTFIDNSTLAYLMAAERSIDIDTEIDMIIADTLLRKQHTVI